MASVLTTNLILQKTKMSDLRHVKKLNVCGVQLTDIGMVKHIPNLEVCSLSVNCISEIDAFSSCQNLQELYLRKNDVRDIGQVLNLCELRNLRQLVLQDNPVCDAEDYRLLVIASLPNLEKLDNEEISPEERHHAERLFPENCAGMGAPVIHHNEQRGSHTDLPPQKSPQRGQATSHQPHSVPAHVPAHHQPPPPPQQPALVRQSSGGGYNHDDQPVGAARRRAPPPQHDRPRVERSPLRHPPVSQTTPESSPNRQHGYHSHRDPAAPRVRDAPPPPPPPAQHPIGVREEAAVHAIAVLMKELSPKGLGAVQRQLDMLCAGKH